MTSFNNNYTNTPYMSDLLKKHLQNKGVYSNAQNAQNTIQINPPKINSDTFLSNSPQEQQNLEDKKGKKVKIAAISLSAAVFISLLTIFGSTKGGKGLIKKATSKVSSGINKGLHKLYESHRSEKLDDAIRKFYSIRENLNFSGAMPNVINGKDVLQRGVVEKLKGKNIDLTNAGSFKKKVVTTYQNIADKVFGKYNQYDMATARLYKRKGCGTLTSLYDKAGKLIRKSDDEILDVLAALKNSPKADEIITHKGAQVKIRDIIPDIEETIKRRQKNFNASFSTEAVSKRYSDMDEYLLRGIDGKNLTEKTTEGFISRIKNKQFKELLSDSVAGNIIKDEKLKRTASVRGMKNKISNTLSSVLEANRDSFVDVRKLIQSDDVDSLHKFDEMLKSIDRFKKTQFTDAASSKEAQGSICAAIEELKKSIVKGARKNGAPSGDAIKALDDVKKSVKNIKSGDTEQLMQMLEMVLEPETYERMVKPSLVKSQKALNKACSMEMYDTMDKLRDINCGSAATDFMTAIMSTGLLGIYTAQADNNDERVSVGLTTGLPIMATVGTNLFAAINQISGNKSWALSLGVGAVTKFVCDGLNKIYRKARGIDESKPSIATIDDYIDPYKNKVENVLKMPQAS